MRFPRDPQLGDITGEELTDVKNLIWGFVGSLFAGLLIYYFLEKKERKEKVYGIL